MQLLLPPTLIPISLIFQELQTLTLSQLFLLIVPEEYYFFSSTIGLYIVPITFYLYDLSACQVFPNFE